ncbi:unnamed protein product, partial [Ectocarpus sp. 8 AP-2014]
PWRKRTEAERWFDSKGRGHGCTVKTFGGILGCCCRRDKTGSRAPEITDNINPKPQYSVRGTPHRPGGPRGYLEEDMCKGLVPHRTNTPPAPVATQTRIRPANDSQRSIRQAIITQSRPP